MFIALVRNNSLVQYYVIRIVVHMLMFTAFLHSRKLYWMSHANQEAKKLCYGRQG